MAEEYSDLIKGHPFAKLGVKYNAPKPCRFPKGIVHEIAEDIARQLLYEPGDSLEEIAETLGGRVHYLDLLEWKKANSGSILVHAPQDFDICLSNFTSPLRDRFTIVHELGHYFLHAGQGDTPLIVARTHLGSNRVEWEANWFAGAFLMPENDIREAYEDLGLDVLHLTARYLVSSTAVEVRLKQLGLLAG